MMSGAPMRSVWTPRRMAIGFCVQAGELVASSASARMTTPKRDFPIIGRNLSRRLRQRFSPLFDLLERQVFRVGGDVPDVAGWFGQRARAVAVELVLHGPTALR